MLELSEERPGLRLIKNLQNLIPSAAMVMLFGWLLGHFVVHFSIWYVITAALAVVLSLLLARRLQYGVLAYFFVALFAFGQSPAVQSPNSHYRAGLMPSQVLLIFFTVLWLGRMILGRGGKLEKNPLNPALAALSVVSIISFVSSNLLRGTRELLFHQLMITQVAEIGLLLCTVFAFLIAANTLKSTRVIKATSIPIILIALYCAPRAIVRFDQPIPVVWSNFMMTAAIALLYARILFDDLTMRRKIGLIAILGILVFSAFYNLSWISGWVATSTAIMVISLYRSKRLAAVLLAVGLIAMFIFPGLYFHIQSESAMGGDYDRFTIWHDAYLMFSKVNPVLGVGPGNYHPYVFYHSSIWMGNGSTYTTAHSNYMQMAAEMGFLGLAVFLYVIVAGLWTGCRAVRRAPPEMKWIALAGLAMFAGIAVASVFGDYLFPSRGNNGLISFGTTVYTWLMLGTAVAASRETGETGES